MESHLRNALEELRIKGYAVVAFTPDELDGAPSDRVEELMCERAWIAIDDLRRPNIKYCYQERKTR